MAEGNGGREQKEVEEARDTSSRACRGRKVDSRTRNGRLSFSKGLGPWPLPGTMNGRKEPGEIRAAI